MGKCNFITVKTTIQLTDKDGIVFDLDIAAINEVARTNGRGSKTVVYVAGGGRIEVRETGVEVMQKIVKARFGR